MTQTLAAVPIQPKTAEEVRANRVLLPNISWDTYSAILTDVGDGAARLTYDHGWLEIEMPGRLHELIRALVDAMITAVLRQQGIGYEPAGATTWRQHEALRGLEADECYHIQSVERVRHKVELDLTVDPPPDLAVEVEVASPLLDKVAVYHGLQVPELWRIHADGSCEMLRLDPTGAYRQVTQSVAVMPFTPKVVTHYLKLRETLGHTGTLARFEVEFLPQLRMK